MFIKPYKVKSNNQLKGTERKKLCDEIAKAYPTLTTDEIQNLVPKKESISVLKAATHNGVIVKIYCNGKLPMFFQTNDMSSILFPTIFTLWQHPNLMYSFVTRELVIPRLARGAHLMLPGVIIPEPVNLHSFGKFKKGHPVSVITDENLAPAAVGVTALSSEDMYMSGGHGKCVEIFHVLGDFLCQMDKLPPRPNLGPPNSLSTQSNTKQECDDQVHQDTLELAGEVDKINLSEEPRDFEEPIIEPEPIDPVKEMDKLLEYCFLKACKVSLKKGDLPIITSTFFKNHMLTVCPSNQSVDVKKSSYKKLSVFLASMKAEGLIETSILKGVESLLSVKLDHPLLKELVLTEAGPLREDDETSSPTVSECYKVTAAVLPILCKFGFEKGDVMKRAEIRKHFTDYVKTEDLQDGKMLKINPILAQILRTREDQESITMEDGINKFIGKMTHSHEITVAGTTLLHTGKLEPIDIVVATRSGNKKVTLVTNLETFGIKLEEFSKECQGIGASATITEVPGKKTPSVLVQGNQVLYVYKLLTEKYRINKNHIKGLEFAPKKRK